MLMVAVPAAMVMPFERVLPVGCISGAVLMRRCPAGSGAAGGSAACAAAMTIKVHSGSTARKLGRCD